jgi:hypothetical protein
MINLVMPLLLAEDSSRLANGATLLRHFGRTVMAHRPGAVHPFVTWHLCPDGSTVTGGYHATEADALLDYALRIEKDIGTVMQDLQVYSQRTCDEVRALAADLLTEAAS